MKENQFLGTEESSALEQQTQQINRKSDHIRLTSVASTQVNLKNNAFNYEPLFSSHTKAFSANAKKQIEVEFLGKKLLAPLWISSMTGGTNRAAYLNQCFAEVAGEFGIGMGLGSCRGIIELLLKKKLSDFTKDDHALLKQFQVRKYIGKENILCANIGQGQVEHLIKENKLNLLNELVEILACDGLIFHINPLQEWYQSEGDYFEYTSLEVITLMLEELEFPLIVKEVGQGFGPKSLRALLELPLAGIEFGAFGGTNFSALEQMRDPNRTSEEVDPLAYVGSSAEEMINNINAILSNEYFINKKKNTKLPLLIISGGIHNYLHGHELILKANSSAIFAQAGQYLKKAISSKECLSKYVKQQVDGLLMAQAYLELS